MARLVTVNFQRANESIPWGFRLQGGADYNQPLSVQRVKPGSLAVQYLSVGDTIIMVEGKDARTMCHFDACELIKAAGNSTEIVVRKSDSKHLCDENLEQQQRLEEQFVVERVRRLTPQGSEKSAPMTPVECASPRRVFSPAYRGTFSPPRSGSHSSSNRELFSPTRESYPAKKQKLSRQRSYQEESAPSPKVRRASVHEPYHSTIKEIPDDSDSINVVQSTCQAEEYSSTVNTYSQHFTQSTHTSNPQTQYYYVDPSVPGLMEAMGYCSPDNISQNTQEVTTASYHSTQQFSKHKSHVTSNVVYTDQRRNLPTSSETTCLPPKFDQTNPTVINKQSKIASQVTKPKVLQRSVSIPEKAIAIGNNEQHYQNRQHQVFSPPINTYKRNLTPNNRSSSVPPPKISTGQVTIASSQTNKQEDINGSYKQFNPEILASRLQFWENKTNSQQRRSSVECDQIVNNDIDKAEDSTVNNAERNERLNLSEDPKQRQLQLLIQEKVRLEEIMMFAKRRQGEAEERRQKYQDYSEIINESKDNVTQKHKELMKSPPMNTSEQDELPIDENIPTLRERQEELRLIEESRIRDARILQMQERKHEQKVRSGTLKACDAKILAESEVPEHHFVPAHKDYEDPLATETYDNKMNAAYQFPESNTVYETQKNNVSAGNFIPQNNKVTQLDEQYGSRNTIYSLVKPHAVNKTKQNSERGKEDGIKNHNETSSKEHHVQQKTVHHFIESSLPHNVPGSNVNIRPDEDQNKELDVIKRSSEFQHVVHRKDLVKKMRALELEQEKAQMIKMLKKDQQKIQEGMNKRQQSNWNRNANCRSKQRKTSGSEINTLKHQEQEWYQQKTLLEKIMQEEEYKIEEEKRFNEIKDTKISHVPQANPNVQNSNQQKTMPPRDKTKKRTKSQPLQAKAIEIKDKEEDEFALLELVIQNQEQQLSSTNPTEMTMELLRLHEEQKMKNKVRKYDEYQQHLEQKRLREFNDSEENGSDYDNDNSRGIYIEEKFQELTASNQAELMAAQEISIRNLDRQLEQQKQREGRKRHSSENKSFSPVPRGDHSREGSLDREAFANLRPYASTGDLQNGFLRTRPITKFSPDPMEFGFKPIEAPQTTYSRSTGNLTHGPTASSIVHLAGAEAGVAAGKRRTKKTRCGVQYGLYNSMDNLQPVSTKPPLPTQNRKKSDTLRHAASEETLRVSERPTSPRRHTYTEGEEYIDFSKAGMNLQNADYGQLLNEYYSAYYEAYYQSYFRKHQAELKEGKMSTPGGPPPPPPPPPFVVPGAVASAPKPVAEPTPVRTMPAAPDQGTIPAALAGAMMKDKKPFTYTPGGLDLSEIKSPRMQKRLQRNASLEGARPPPVAQQPATTQTSAPMGPIGMVQVLPTGGMSMAPKPAKAKEPAKPKTSNCGPPPPPPPFGVVGSPEVTSPEPIPTKYIEAMPPQHALHNKAPQSQTNGGNIPISDYNEPLQNPCAPDVTSDVTGTSSPSYPDDLNSIHNRSEDSLDVNTISSEIEPKDQIKSDMQSRWIAENPINNQEHVQQPIPFERPVPVRTVATPPLSLLNQREPYEQAPQPEAKPQLKVNICRQSSLPPRTSSPVVKSGSLQRDNVFIPQQESPADHAFYSPKVQSSPGSGTVDKPLPWMVGLKKEDTPTEFMQQAPIRQPQQVQRQKSLPQQKNQEVTAPWRQPRASQGQQMSPNYSGTQEPTIIPPPDVFRDQMYNNQNTWAPETNYEQWQSHQYQLPQGKERIIPIMMEDTPPVTPVHYGAPPRLNRVPSSPGNRTPGARPYSNPPSTEPGSAFMNYSPSYSGRDEPHQNGPIVYLQNAPDEAPIQSKSFRVIQTAYDKDSRGNGGVQDDSPRTYSGSNIPSRSFKALQQMTDNAMNGSRQEHQQHEENTASPVPSYSTYSPTPSSYLVGQKSEDPPTRKSWRSKPPVERTFSPVGSNYRSVSLGPEFNKPSHAFSDSPSRLMDIVEQETKAMAAKGQTIPNDCEQLPSQLLRQLQNDNYVNLRSVNDRSNRPTSWTAPQTNDVSNKFQPINLNSRPVPDNIISPPSSTSEDCYDVHDGMMRTAASKQSVLKELTSRFDPSTSHKKPKAAPGRVFKQLQEQYDSLEDQDDLDSRGSSDMRSPSLMRDTMSPSCSNSSGEKYEFPVKTYGGSRVPGRTFRMLQENIDTHPSVLIARK